VCGYDKDVDGYYSWGDSYDHYKIGNPTFVDYLKEFPAIMLKEVSENEHHIMSTVSGSIYNSNDPVRKVFLAIDTDNYIRTNFKTNIIQSDPFDGFGLGQLKISTIHKMISVSIKHEVEFKFARFAAGYNDNYKFDTMTAIDTHLFVFVEDHVGDLTNMWNEIEKMGIVKADIKKQTDIQKVFNRIFR